MRTKHWILATALGLILSGCNSPSETATSSPTPQTSTVAQAATAAHVYEEGSIKKGEQALCVVCVVNEGTTEKEKVAETIDYEGKTYAFCSEEEKAAFISEPGKFAVKE